MWPWTGLRAGSRSGTERGGSRRAAGFTLIEVLVAFVILALALGTMLPGFASGLRGLDTADGYTTAALLAESHLAMVGRNRPLAEGATRGEYENGFGWQLEITARDDLDPDQRLPVRAYDVVLTVSWDAGGDSPRSIRLQTLRLGPV